MSRPLRFWGSAVGASLAFALATALLLPYEALQLRTEADRWQAWLLTLWTTGIMGVLFGLSGLLGFLSPLGIRDVAEAGSVTKALAERGASRAEDDPGRYGNFAGWLIVAGAALIGLYFASWILLRNRVPL